MTLEGGVQSAMRWLVVGLLAIIAIVGCSSDHPSAASRASTSSSTPAPIGRVVTTSLLYRSGLMRLDPSDGATASIPATQALASAGGTKPGDIPQVLLGRLTVFDYGRETNHGLVRFVDRRLVWLVVYPHHDLMIRYCATRPGQCPPRFGTVFIPVDARSGVALGTWS